MRSQSGAAEPALAGVGIIFACPEMDERPKLVVESLMHNGAASSVRDRIRKGDVLVDVDGTCVQGMRPYDLVGLILGPGGSAVVLEFERQEADAVPERTVRFRCTVIRSHSYRRSTPSSSASSLGTDSRSRDVTVSGTLSDV